MAQITVNFTFHSGVKRHLFSNVRLSGSWNASGQFSINGPMRRWRPG